MTSIPYHPIFCQFNKRLNTFIKLGWPIGLSQTAQQMASAGFFYRGFCDEVFCFHCGGGIRKWKVNDDPWIEHNKFYPLCSSILVKNKLKSSLGSEEIYSNGSMRYSDVERDVTVNQKHAQTENKEEESVIKPEDQKNKCIVTLENLLEENNKLKNDRLCKICFQNDANIVIIPCGHIITCNNCIMSLEICPICRHEILTCVKSYFA